jgi:two-component system sensor histidine kinase VicK
LLLVALTVSPTPPPRPSHPTNSKQDQEETSTTKIIYGVETVIDTVSQLFYKTNHMIDACLDCTLPSLTAEILVLREAFLDAKKRGVRLRYLTGITKSNISYCKQLLTMVDELRHLDGIKCNFYISDTEYLAPAIFHEEGKPASQIIYSNLKEIVEHQRYVFETLWSKAIPSEKRISEIEIEGGRLPNNH